MMTRWIRRSSTCLRVGAWWVMLSLWPMAAWAGDNAIESVSAARVGRDVRITVMLRDAPLALPDGFATNDPPRIVLDFAATANASGKRSLPVGLDGVLRLRLADTGDMTRLVLELAAPRLYRVALEGKVVLVTVQEAAEVNAATARPPPVPAAPGRLSFNFQDVPVRAALQAIADVAGLNLVVSDSVGGNLTLRLRELPWEQALEVILQARRLARRQRDGVLWVAPLEELLEGERQALEQQAQIAELAPLQSHVFQLNYLKAESFRQVFGLDAPVPGVHASAERSTRVLSRRGSAMIEPRSNQLFVTDTAERIEAIGQLIARTDVAARQVLIEARLVEANDGFARNLGARLQFLDQRNNKLDSDLAAAPVGGVAPASLALSLFSSSAKRLLNVELSALEAEGRGRIVSHPRLVTEDRHGAVIEQGIELPYEVATSSGATSITFKKANLRLEVTPQITPDGKVVLEVDVSKDSKGEATRAGFAINTQHVKTRVTVDDGGTVVLGGIYQQAERDDVTQVPLLGRLPVFGHLFRTRGRENGRTELLVFITPSIVADAMAADGG